MASRTESMTKILKELQKGTPDIEASAIVSVDGLIMASALPQDVEEDRVAAMSAEIRTLAEAGVRSRHPEYGPDEVRAAVADILLGPDLAAAARRGRPSAGGRR